MQKIVILILIDSLRHDYVTKNGTPFLYGLGEEGIRGRLIPTFGFEPDAAYFAGLYPEECDGGMHYWYDPKNSPFRFRKFWLSWLQYLPHPCKARGLPEIPELLARRAISWIAQKNSKYSALRSRASTEHIPFKFLPYFDFSTKYLPLEQGFISGKQTIFDLLRENKKSWLFHASPSQSVSSESVLRRAENELKPPHAFAFLHIGDLDGTGHKYGPNSVERKETLHKVDAHIARIYEIARERFKDVHLLIFGDHGMAEVKQRMDIWLSLKKLNLITGKDYVFFLDSTMARFWFFNEKAKKQIVSLLHDFKQGHILTKEERIGYHINYLHDKFGDLIFLVDPETLIFPNFFQKRRPVKGMHGYAPEFKDQQSAFLIHSPRIKTLKVFEEVVDMRWLFPTILDLLEIVIPKTGDVISLLSS